MSINMEGAVILATGNPHMAPLKRTGAGWTAFISIARPGVYDRGTVVFPDGSTYTWSLTDPFDGFFTSRGVLQVTFEDSGEIGAEITRRMLALAA